jgi:diguanylate cyclase (GGDEF)-like protein
MTTRDELTQDLRQLVQVTKTISSSLQIEAQLPVIMDAVIQLTHADKAMLLLCNSAGELEIKAEHPARHQPTKKDGKYSTTLIQQVMTEGEAAFVLDTDLHQQMKASDSIQSLQLRTVMCAPLRSNTGIIGVLYVHSTTPVRAFNEQKKEIFVALCDHAAIALDNARLYSASISDPMTGLYNHAYGMRRLEEEIDRARRYGRCLTFMLIDIDGLKAVNDTLGHRKGDAVIRAVAEALRQTVRQSDVAARYGGDEFALIIPETGGVDRNEVDTAKSGAMVLGERVRERIAKSVVAGTTVTASIGVATFPSDGAREGEASDLVERADTAMYAAKKKGRNQVCEAPAPKLSKN